MLRAATCEDIPAIQSVYAEAGNFAHRLGSTNTWDMNTPYCEKLIAEDELFCYEDDTAVQAVVRLSTATNPKEWPNGNENHLFIAKLASADAVRGMGFVPRKVLPEIEQEATSRGMVGLRLNCFPSPKLIHFYEKACDFALRGVVSFDSPTIGRRITTAKFEKELV